MKYLTRNVIMGRKPRKEGCDWKTVFFKLFDGPRPLRGGDFPSKEIEFENIEYVSFTGQCEFYPEGNDLVFRDIQSIELEQLDTKLLLTIQR